MKTIPVIAVFSIHEEADPGELWGCPEEEFDRLRGMGAVVTLEEAQARGIGQVDDSLIASLKEGAGSGFGSDEARRQAEKDGADRVRDPQDPPDPPDPPTNLV